MKRRPNPLRYRYKTRRAQAMKDVKALKKKGYGARAKLTEGRGKNAFYSVCSTSRKLAKPKKSKKRKGKKKR